MFIAVELARSGSHYGAWALSTDAPELPTLLQLQSVQAKHHECSKENIQTHGGMGFRGSSIVIFIIEDQNALSANIGVAVWKDKLIIFRRANQI